MKYEFIKENKSQFTVEKICQILDVKTSSFYAWNSSQPCDRKIENDKLSLKIREVFDANDGNYGSPRITIELHDLGFQVGHNRVAKLMKEMGLFVVKKSTFMPQTTDSNHDLPISANLLNQNFSVDGVNKVWVSDITYVRVNNKWVYLCVILDLFNRKVVGWSISHRMKTSLLLKAFNQAVKKENPEAGLIFHSDRGSQYASKAFRKSLLNHKFNSSMSRKGNCYDNACAESFFKTIKTERIYKDCYHSLKEATIKIFEYIEIYYNRVRKHSTLGYKSPLQFTLLHGN